ncbi:MAG: hypothetical protein R2818_02145 [Flavobacteriales bacterium]
MMRSITLLAASALILSAFGQRHIEIGVSGGVTHYYGDLGNIDGPIQWNSSRPGMNITFRDFLNNPKRYVTRSITTEARLSWFRIGYDETASISGTDVKDLKNYKRGLSFRNDLVGASGHLVLNAYREPFTPLFQQRFFMYFHIGVGVYYGRPKADLFRGEQDIANRYYFWEDGTVRDAPRGSTTSNVIQKDGTYETDLYSWLTEGGVGAGDVNQTTRFSPWHVGIPMGAGLRYMITKQTSIGIEYCYMMFMTDMLDDVSDRYSTYDEIDATYSDPRKQELARYISDPTGWGTNGEYSIITSRRGNPGLLDSFSYFSFEVSYKFKKRPGRRSFMSL